MAGGMLDERAAQAALDACAITLTGDGVHDLGTRERAALDAIGRDILDTSVEYGEGGIAVDLADLLDDACHVLAGWSGVPDGEVGLAAFESGASRQPQLDNVMAILLHLCAGIEVLESYISTRQTPVDVLLLIGEMACGSAAAPEIMAADWDFWTHAADPIDVVRGRLGVSAGGNSAGAGQWAARAGAGAGHAARV